MPSTSVSRGPTPRKPAVGGFFWALGVIALDQASKYLVVERMRLDALGTIHVLPLIDFKMAWNSGVNFGLLSGGGAPFVPLLLLTLAMVLGAALLFAASNASTLFRAAGLGIAAGGAFGNAIDRLRHGAVADFLNVSCCGFHNPWSFNVADIAIFFGFGMLLWPDPTKRRAVS
jgi:signal peptidase II